MLVRILGSDVQIGEILRLKAEVNESVLALLHQAKMRIVFVILSNDRVKCHFRHGDTVGPHNTACSIMTWFSCGPRGEACEACLYLSVSQTPQHVILDP